MLEAVPRPVREIWKGLGFPGSLWVTSRVACREPWESGLKVTVMVCSPVDATVKGAAVPPTVNSLVLLDWILLMVRGEPPEFAMVRVLVLLALTAVAGRLRAALAGRTAPLGPFNAKSGWSPVAERFTRNVPSSGSLLTMVRVPVLVPPPLGRKVTVNSWKAPALTLPGTPATSNSVLPEVMPFTVRGTVALLFSRRKV